MVMMIASQQKTLTGPHLATPAIKPQGFRRSRLTGQAGNNCHQSTLAALLPNQGYVCTQQTTMNLTNLSIN